MRHPQLLVHLDGQRNEVRVEAEHVHIEQPREIPRQLVHALQTRLQVLAESLDVRYRSVVRQVRVLSIRGHIQLHLAEQPGEEQVAYFGVLLLIQPVVPEHLDRAHHH